MSGKIVFFNLPRRKKVIVLPVFGEKFLLLRFLYAKEGKVGNRDKDQTALLKMILILL